MSPFVLIRWVMPAGHVYGSPREVIEALVAPTPRVPDSPRELIETLIMPAVRRSGWLSSPDTTHDVSDRGTEAWVTVVTTVDDATQVREELAEHLKAAPAFETADDLLVAPEARSYRAALQDVTHLALDLLEGRGAIPVVEHEALARPSEAALRLVPVLSRLSPTYRRVCPDYAATERFWLDFFRRGPAPGLEPPGRRLWNLAG